jgi:hypothetical protein
MTVSRLLGDVPGWLVVVEQDRLFDLIRDRFTRRESRRGTRTQAKARSTSRRTVEQPIDRPPGPDANRSLQDDRRPEQGQHADERHIPPDPGPAMPLHEGTSSDSGSHEPVLAERHLRLPHDPPEDPVRVA